MTAQDALLRAALYPTDGLSADLRAVVDAWGRVCFTDPHGITWSTNPTWRCVIYLDETPVSYLDIYDRQCTVGGQPLRLAGISTVMTPPEQRGHGFATFALQRAAAFMRDELQAPFGLLVTGTRLLDFYGRLGWQRVHAPLRFFQPDGQDKSDRIEVIMILPLAGQPWPEGTIDLCGLPW